MAVTDLFGIINKVMSRFNWDRKSIRRSKIKKIEKEIDEILTKPVDDKLSRRLNALRNKLSALRQQATND